MEPGLGDILRKEAYNSEWISVSWHEAGHCIYALLHHRKVTSVRVYLDKDIDRIVGETNYDGLCIDDIHDNIARKEYIDCDIGLSYAGLIAEKRHYKLSSGSDVFPAVLYDAYYDSRDASKLIVKYDVAPPGKARINYKARIKRKVAKELEANWNDVSLIAHALFKRKRLSLDDLRGILTKKSDDNEGWKERFVEINDLYCEPIDKG
jgi:hypothetical protein